MEIGTPDISVQSASVLLIGPDRTRRGALTHALRRLGVEVKQEVAEYPSYTRTAALAGDECDAVLIDLDADPQAALLFVETYCALNKPVTAMLYTQNGDPELLVKCMRAGARELIYLPVEDEALTEAIVRAAARRETQAPRRLGKMHVFHSAKGGAGASTVAVNFAVALAHETKAEVALVDWNGGFGDLAVLLNLSPRFSVLDAVRSPERLDWDFLSTLLAPHSSGVRLLAAHDQLSVTNGEHRAEGVEKLFLLLREKFAHVVVDAGRTFALPASVLKHAESVSVVTQVDVPSLRHAQRYATFLSEEIERRDSVQIIINRFDARNSGITATEAERALTFPAKWRIPNDYGNVTGAANAGLCLAGQSSPIAKMFRRMAETASGKAPKAVSKSWTLFGLKKG
ncbi:MAG: hypothetical protein JST93_11900 [Acidobacteria bacterium]|nr:hypothetical protein [Acidobacteriota bacterium]